MKKFMKSYKSSIILIMAVVIGTFIGLIFKEKASVLSPLGDIFINMLLVVVVPLIFLSITVSISKIKSPKRLGKIMITTIVTFIVTSLVAVVVGFVSTYKINLVDTDKVNAIKSVLVENTEVEELNILERTAKTLTVSKFGDLLNTDNLIALLVFSIIFGIAINMAGNKGDKAREVLESFNEVIMKVVNIIMYYAPIGFMCCTASLVGTFGSAIAVGYIKTFVIYTVVCLLFYFIMYTIYGICCFCISFILAILWNPIVLLAGVMLFVVFAVTEQDTIKSRANDMRTQIQDDLPRFLDLLKTELSIGLAVENAIYILCSKYDCLLSKEFLEALNKSEMGLDGWQKALEDISEKYDVESLSNFVMDITTSYRKGVNVATSVTREAEEVKKKYILDIKERAGKVTNLILIPIAIFQFIPLIAFLMFPAITSVFNGF